MTNPPPMPGRTLIGLQASVLAANPLGPGIGPWAVEAPERHGLTRASLEQAADELFDQESLGRGCFLIVKDGAIVFERYANGYEDGAHPGYSMTKSLGALLIGWASAHWGLDIDADTSWYGTPSPRPFAVTPRQIMSQAVSGEHGPGEAWAYDSGGTAWINRLTSVFTNATCQGASGVWREAFEGPLGLSANFSWTNADDVWAYGSEGSCRDYARIGQLLLNRGAWPDADGRPRQLVPAEYVDAMGTPQTRYAPYDAYANACYGLLTWLNPMQDAQAVPGACLVPGRSWTLPQSEPIHNSSLWPKALSPSIFFAGGAYGQLAMVLPEDGAVAVSLGHSTDPRDHGNHDYTAACVARSLAQVFARRRPSA